MSKGERGGGETEVRERVGRRPCRADGGSDHKVAKQRPAVRVGNASPPVSQPPPCQYRSPGLSNG